MFSAAKEKEAIAAGTHFYCHAHLCAVMIERRSAENPDYCVDCWRNIRDTRRNTAERAIMRQNGDSDTETPEVVVDSQQARKRVKRK